MLIDFRQLFPKYNIKPKGVLHVGANVGEEAPIYDELGIDKQVWIEANKDIFSILNAKLSYKKYRHCFCFAASDEDTTGILHISNNGSQSSSLLELETHKIAHPEVHYIKDYDVKIYRIETFFKDIWNSDIQIQKIEGGSPEYANEIFPYLDLLNMDIQGNELKALKGMGELLHQFKWAYLEVNKEELYKGCALINEVEEYMNRFGFKIKEIKWCGNTGWGDCFMSKD